MRLPTRTLMLLKGRSALKPNSIRQPHLYVRRIHVAPTSGHGMLSSHAHPHPHAPKLPKDSYMYEIFAGVVACTCGVLGYLVCMAVLRS
jgi:hypothetical protein